MFSPSGFAVANGKDSTKDASIPPQRTEMLCYGHGKGVGIGFKEDKDASFRERPCG
jgi:hypothetical protein